MNKLATSWTIIRHSLFIMARHPRLLVFPLISLVVALLLYLFFLAPVLFDMSVADVWYTLQDPDETWDSLAPWRAAEKANGSLWFGGSFPGMATYYLLAMFGVTFINVALYSQIIESMNGGQVSIARGFALAGARVRAIAAWSLLAGTVGLILNAIQERTGFLGRWMAGLAGVSWSAASVFVIPVIINEPQPRSPFEYVRISSALLRRVWGEGVIALTGATMMVVVVMACMMALSFSLLGANIELRMQIAIIASMASLIVFTLIYLAYQIFECGLYVYATQGVAPGTFDEAIFDRAWTVKRGAAVKEEHKARQVSRAGLWLLVPVAVGALILWINFLRPQAMPVREPQAEFGRIAIDLAGLDYALDFEDLQAAGLLLNTQCPNCDFSAAGATVKASGQGDPSFRGTVWRDESTLYIYVSGTDRAGGEQRFRHSLEALQARFPGSEAAINKVDNFPYKPRTTKAAWTTVAGARSYTIELDCYHCCGPNRWCTDIGSKWKIVPDLTTTAYTFDWVGAQPGRWRVWAIGESGRRGKKSGWTYFDYSR